jgi:hypothetical protein
MKWILVTLLLISYLNINSSIRNIGRKIKPNISYIIDGNKVLYNMQYKAIIEELKVQEGFRAEIYDDHSYDCVGYGQRIKFYPYKIVTPLTVKQAEDILNISFGIHLKGIQRLYPKIDKVKQLRLTKLSYQSGIVKVIKLMKNQI